MRHSSDDFQLSILLETDKQLSDKPNTNSCKDDFSDQTAYNLYYRSY